VNMQGKHRGHTSTCKGSVLGNHRFVARWAAQPRQLAGGCSEHVSHGSRVFLEGIHRAETSRRRPCAEGAVCGAQAPCPCKAAQMSCCQVATSTSPTSPTLPAPPPRFNAPMCRHGKLRPRHPLPHRDQAHHPFLVAAGKKARQHRKKCHVGTAAAEKRAPVESAFMAASTESLSALLVAALARAGRAGAHASMPIAAT
jgi:hypothetical protein